MTSRGTYSIRRRLLLVLTAGFAVLLLGTGAYLYDSLGDRVIAEFDSALLSQARSMISLTEQENGRIEFDYASEHMEEFEREQKPDYFQFWLDDGQMLLRSMRLGEGDLPGAGDKSGGPHIRDAQLPDGRAGRLVAWTFRPKQPDDSPEEASTDGSVAPADTDAVLHAVTLVLARGRDGLDELLANLAVAIFGLGGVSTVLAIVLVWRALDVGFRPIVQIADQVERLNAEKLDARVTLARTPTEIGPIVEQLNALLVRLHDSFERERRFTGNVAHELRTPVAELRSLAEVAAKWPDDRQATARFFEDVQAIAGRMEGVIADLLLLARCQAGVETVARTPTSLREVVAATWSKIAMRADALGLRFASDVPEDLMVQSDPGKLEIVVSNLLGNAVNYAPPNSEIRCVASRDAVRFQLDVTNPAEPMDASDLRRLAEPFWRKDFARSGADHAGLGLSVVTALAVLLGLDVGFEQNRDGLFRVRLEGPLSFP